MQPTTKTYHLNLALYFNSKPLYLDEAGKKKPNARKLIEQPWQEVKAKSWKEVAETLCDLLFIEAKCSATMIDELMTDYYHVHSQHPVIESMPLWSFRRFVQDNSHYLRSHSNWCLQLAMLESTDSPVRKEASQITTTLSIPCFANIHYSSGNFRPEIRFNEHKKPIQALLLNTRNGLLMSSDGKEVIRWDIESSAIVSRFTLPEQNSVAGTAYVGEGRWKISFAEQSDSIIVGNVLYNGTTGREINRFISRRITEGELIAPPAISQDSSIAAFSTRKMRQPNTHGSDHFVTVISSNNGLVIAELPHTGMVSFMAFSSDLKFIVTLQYSPSYDQGEKADNKGLMRVWDITTIKEVFRFEGSFDRASFSSDCIMLVAQSRSTIYGWHTSDWSQLFIMQDFTETKFGILVLDNSSVITWGTNSVTLWDIHKNKISGRMIFSNFRNGIFSLILSDDQQRFIIGFGDGLIELLNIETLRKSNESGGLSRTEDSIRNARHLAFSPDGKRIVICFFKYLVSIVDVDSNTQIVSREFITEENGLTQTNEVKACYYTNDGSSIVLVFNSSRPDVNSERTPFGNKYLHFGSIRRVSATDLADQAVFEFGSQQFIHESRITPYDVYCSVSGDVFRLSLDNLVITKKYGRASAWAFSENFIFLALGTPEGLLIWNNAKNTKVELQVGDPTMQPQFSPDGTLIVASSYCTRNYRSEILKVYSIRQRAELFYIRQELDSGYYAWQCPDYWKYSNDGKRILLIKGESKSILDLNTGLCCQLETSGPNHSDMKYSSSFKTSYKFFADDRFLSEIEQNTVRIWVCKSGKLLAILPLEKIEAADWNPTTSVLGIFHASYLELFHILNIDQSPPIVNAMKMPDNKTTNNCPDYTAICIQCANKFQVSDSIITTIFEIYSKFGVTDSDAPSLILPDEAWDDPRLKSECPICHKLLTFNPFVVGEEHEPKQKWKFWKR